MADVASLAIQIDVNGAQRARQALAGLQDGSVRATRATDNLVASTVRMNQATRSTAGAFRIQKGAIQQVGFQVGDFATQVSAGQSAIVAFGQQASQLAGIMGPGGALLGAVIAIGSGIAGAFARSMMTGADSTENLTEKTRELVKELGRATERQREFINTSFQQEIEEQARRAREAESSIEFLEERLQRFRKTVGENVPEAVFNSNSAVKSLRDEMDELRLVMDNSESSTAAIEKAQREFWKAVRETGSSADDTSNDIQELVDKYELQAESIGKSARQIALYEAAARGATAEDIARINAAFDQIDAEKQRLAQAKETAKQERQLQQMRMEVDPAGEEFNRYADQIDQIEQFNITAEEKERLREEQFRIHQENMARIAGEGGEQIAQSQSQGLQLLTSAQQSALSSFGQIFGNMAEIAEKGGEDQFNTWKAMAIAQAGVNTALAISNALATPPAPLGIALAGTIGALGAVQVAQIQQTEYQGSYLGGGYTGMGSRTGGIDGRGGFPAILHPNETVIDHEMGQRSRGGSSNTEANVTQVFQLSDNARREAKQQILESAPMIQQMAKQAVLQAINQGGAMSRAVGRRS